MGWREIVKMIELAWAMLASSRGEIVQHAGRGFLCIGMERVSIGRVASSLEDLRDHRGCNMGQLERIERRSDNNVPALGQLTGFQASQKLD